MELLDCQYGILHNYHKPVPNKIKDSMWTETIISNIEQGSGVQRQSIHIVGGWGDPPDGLKLPNRRPFQVFTVLYSCTIIDIASKYMI